MAVGVDCGGRKITIVSTTGVYAHFEIKKIDWLDWYMRAPVWLAQYSQLLKDEEWFIEAPVVAGAKNLQSTIKVAQTTGLVRAEVPDAVEVAVSSWKKATVGNGNASKDQVRQWLARTHPQIAQMCGENQDLHDAACIALYGASRTE